MKIEADLITIKAAIFFFQAALACFLPFKSIFQKQLGVSATQNGIIMAVEKGASLVAPPIIGAIADKFSLYKPTMIGCAVLSVAFTFPMYFLPEVPDDDVACCSGPSSFCIDSFGEVFNATCGNATDDDLNNTSAVQCNGNYVTFSCDCSEHFNESDSITCPSASRSLHCINPSADDVYGLTFSLMVLLSVLTIIAWVPLSSLIDATTMHILGPQRSHSYGQQRLWGAVGFGLVGLLTGFLIDVLTKSSRKSGEKDYLFAFVGFAFFQAVTAAICCKLKVPKHKFPSILSGLLTLIRNIRISLLLLVIFMSGFNLGARYAFLFWYVVSLPDSSQTLLGLTVLSGCFSEIPTFFIAGWVFKRTGYDLVLSLGLCVAALQCFLYTEVGAAWHVILIEACHGFSFALPMAAMCTYASSLAPEGMTGTLVGLTQGVYWGIGNMTGALVSGFLYNSYGAEWMFRINALIAVVSAAFYYIAVAILNARSPPANDKGATEAGNPMLDSKDGNTGRDV